MKIKDLIGLAVATYFILGCSSGNGTGADTNNNAIVDSVAFEEGREHAANMFDTCPDSVAMSLYLLDTRAIIDEILDDRGTAAATDYERGFTEYIRFYDPEMAAKIL